MKPIHWIVIIILIVGFGIYWFTIHPSSDSTPQGTTSFKCTDGRVVFRYNDPENAFPEFTRNYEASYKVTSGLLGKFANDTDDAAIALGVKNIAQALIDTLDQQNIFYQTTLKAYFIESNNEPCNQELRDKYLAFINDMGTKMMTMRSFVSQVTTNTTEAKITTDTSKVLAVIDTAKAKVDTSIKTWKQIPTNNLVVLKNYKRLNIAVSDLAKQYKINTAALQ